MGVEEYTKRTVVGLTATILSVTRVLMYHLLKKYYLRPLRVLQSKQLDVALPMGDDTKHPNVPLIGYGVCSFF